MKKRLAWIWRYWREHKKILPILIVLTFLSTAVAVAYPLVFKYIVNLLRELAKTKAPEVRDEILSWVGVLLLVGAGRSLRNIYPMMRAWMNCIIEMRVRQWYFRRILDKSHRFFLTFRTGDIVTRLTDDIYGWPKIAWFMCSGIFRALESGSWLVFCIVAMILVDWRLGLVAISPLPIMMFFVYRLQMTMGRRMRRNQDAISSTNDMLESCYSGIRILKAYRGEKRQKEKLGEVLRNRIEIEMDMVKLWAIWDSLFFALTNAGRVLILGFGSFWILDGSLSLGSFMAIWIYVEQLGRPMMDLPQLFASGRQAFVCIDRLEELSDFEKEFVDGEGGALPVGKLQTVALEDVSFRYRSDLPADTVSSLNLSVPSGHRTAVVGPVGAGKSTLVRLLTGELQPGRGRVTVNGRDLKDLDLTDYRRRVGYIPQEALLFSDTVRENIAFGRDVDDEGVLDALRVAQMDEEVAAFPKGLDELLGQRGVRVSGGQRQRLAAARALADRPGLVVMDDVTAALDAENEEALWDALLEREPDLTAVIVTHRMSTARRADEIVVMDRGRIVDRGTYSDLLTRSDLFRRLAAED